MRTQNNAYIVPKFKGGRVGGGEEYKCNGGRGGNPPIKNKESQLILILGVGRNSINPKHHPHPPSLSLLSARLCYRFDWSRESRSSL
jgi:hypothetical protein